MAYTLFAVLVQQIQRQLPRKPVMKKVGYRPEMTPLANVLDQCLKRSPTPNLVVSLSVFRVQPVYIQYLVLVFSPTGFFARLVTMPTSWK